MLLGGCAGPDLSRFEQVLAANDSATAALGQWCEARRIASPPLIRALADRTAQAPATPDIRTALGVSSTEPVGYRHVQLTCGRTVLSFAHNWYVPSRLTPAMNRTLETSDVPFGKVVAQLGFRRERLASRRGPVAECPDGTVLSHRAALRLGDGRAISLVVECYTRANIAAGAVTAGD
ncbi:MAG: hypothetical protein NTX28_14405 [Novosphingobium sp.]|nr:hypothetical protein [Novosphingobium sp.]